MRKFAILLIVSSYMGFSQSVDTLYINYFDNAPFASIDSGKTKGLEIDIVNEYLLWLKTTKKLPSLQNLQAIKILKNFMVQQKQEIKIQLDLDLLQLTLKD